MAKSGRIVVAKAGLKSWRIRANGQWGPSGSNLTFESLLGFPRFAACASLRDARRKIHHRFVGRSASAWKSHRRSQCRAEVRVASRDCSLHGRWGRHERDHATNLQVQDLRLALAGTLLGRRVRGSASRQDQALADQAARWRIGRAGCRPDAWRSTRRNDPLDRCLDGEGVGPQC